MKAVGQSQLIANAAEEKRKTIKNLIEKIPTAKDELFGYKVDWAIVDEVYSARCNMIFIVICIWTNKLGCSNNIFAQ